MLEELRKQQEETRKRILKSFGYDSDTIQKSEDSESLNDLIRKGEVEIDDELEKAVYADTAENRRLGRVGQEYHRGRKKSTTTPPPAHGGKKTSLSIEGLNKIDGVHAQTIAGKNGNYLSLTISGNKASAQKALKRINSQFGTNYSLDDFEHSRPTRYTDNEYSIEIGKNSGSSGGSNKQKSGSSKLLKINSSSSAAAFLTKNAEKYMDYVHDDEDMDENTRKNFDAASKYIKVGKTFTAGSQEAIDYEEKMGKKGYHVVDITPGSGDQTTYALIKKK